MSEEFGALIAEVEKAVKPLGFMVEAASREGPEAQELKIVLARPACPQTRLNSEVFSDES
ncbi:MAG: hypothetical protein FWH41_04720 [Treponema sp.]|nr:hypothetical protein [Treponema sp.]